MKSPSNPRRKSTGAGAYQSLTDGGMVSTGSPHGPEQSRHVLGIAIGRKAEPCVRGKHDLDGRRGARDPYGDDGGAVERFGDGLGGQGPAPLIKGGDRDALGGTELRDGEIRTAEPLDPFDPLLTCGRWITTGRASRINGCVRRIGGNNRFVHQRTLGVEKDQPRR